MKKKDREPVDKTSLAIKIFCTLLFGGVAAILIVAFCESNDKPFWWVFSISFMLVICLVVIWTSNVLGDSTHDVYKNYGKPSESDQYIQDRTDRILTHLLDEDDKRW